MIMCDGWKIKFCIYAITVLSTYCQVKKKQKTEAVKETEHQLQKACVQWFRLQYPSYDKLLFAIPNGGKRHVAVAAKMKAEGVLRGVPDLFLAVPREGKGYDRDIYHGLFIEMKAGKNNLTKEQKTMFEILTEQGYRCELCRSFEEFHQVIGQYLD